jgi:hypothetical protein
MKNPRSGVDFFMAEKLISPEAPEWHKLICLSKLQRQKAGQQHVRK